MRSIESDIKNNQLKHIYLLYGEEAYLVRRYKHALIEALLPEADEMNFSRFQGKDIDEDLLIETANTLPFFSACRVLLIEDTGLLGQKTTRLGELFDDLLDTTYLIFVEEKVDKRLSLYKKIAKVGGIEEMTMPDERFLAGWMVRRVKKAGLAITKAAWEEFFLRAGDSMDNMSNEMDKLIAYCEGKDAIQREDVDAICMNWLEGKVFALIEAIAARQAAQAMALYRDMLLLHEEPMKILAIMRSQFVRLYLLKDMDRHRESERDISARTRIPVYYLRKNRQLAANFSAKELGALLIEAGNLEADMKTGRIDKQIGLEMLIAKYA